jgi:D-glycero-alpha-D-manno-heptose-7-phosphate kinase
MFWTGHQPDTRLVLAEQKRNIEQTLGDLVAMRGHAHQLQDLLLSGSVEPGRIGALLDETWQRKRRLAGTITTPEIDGWYARAREAGAQGGKLLGAGGGGCLLFVASREDHDSVRSALADLIEVEVRPEVHGSQVVAPFAT